MKGGRKDGLVVLDFVLVFFQNLLKQVDGVNVIRENICTVESGIATQLMK